MRQVMGPGFLSISLLFLASLPLAAQIPPPHHVLYVDGVHGNDTNNCKTRKTACKTIGHAISLASPDDAVLVAPATYDENLTINFNLGIIGSGASTTIIDGQQLNTVVNINDGQVILAGFTIRNGVTEGGGGGIGNNGATTIYDSVIAQNVAEYGEGESDGAGIYNSGTLTLDRSTVTQNQTKNVYYSYGAGIYNVGSLRINDSTVSGNSSKTTDTYGAGIFNGGTLVINRSTLNGNSTGDGASTMGGGIDNTGIATINNSTLAGNSSQGGVGGGISNEDDGTLTVSSSTISGNTAGYGGGGFSNSSTATIQNSIVSDSGGGNCEGTFTSKGYNLSSDDTCNFSGPGDLNNTEPKLGPLQNNGGPTQTMSEAVSSPTVDAGNPSGCTDGQGRLLTTDQRGAPRPGKNKHDKRCDMGAFERQTD
jgi:hypothetical protein